MKCNGFFTFAQNIHKNITKNLSDKYNQKLLGHVIQSVTDAFQTTSKGVIQKNSKSNC